MKLKRIISFLTTLVMVAGILPVIMIQTAFAVAATSVVATATFNGDGLAALADNLLVTFTEPVCGDADCTEALTISNFVYADASGVAQVISSVTHTAGTDWALVTMNSVFDAGNGDTASTVRVEEVYTASGMLKEDSALTVSLTADVTAPTISVKGIKDATDVLLLTFSEPVGDETGAALVNADFTYVDAAVGNAGAFGNAAIHTSDRRSVIFDLDVVVAAGDHADAADDHITIADNKLYDLVGNEIAVPAPAAEIDLSDFTADVTIPTISSAYGRIGQDATGGNDAVLVNFSEPVFNAATHTGALVAADFAHSTAAVSTFTHTAGNAFGVMDLNANQTALGTVDSEAGDDDVYDAFGNVLTAATAAVAITDNTFPTLRGVWVNQFIDHGSTAGLVSASFAAPVGANAVLTNERATTVDDTTGYPNEGSKMYYLTDATGWAADEGFMSYDTGVDLYDTTNDLYEFTQVKFDVYYQDADGAVTLDDDGDLEFVLNDSQDFLTPSRFPITTNLPDDGTWTTVTIDLTGTATGTALASQVTNPQYWGIRVAATTDLATSDDIYVDNIRFSRGASSKSNQVILEYSEAVDLAGDPAVGASAASATTAGDMTTSKTLAGMGAFAAGTFTTKTLTNTVAKSADGTTYTITMADRAGGLVTQATPVSLSGAFTPTANVTDVATNAIAVGSTHTPETVIDTFDITSAATAVTDFRIISILGSGLRAVWDSPAQTAATFSHYVVTYGTGAAVSVASSLWDDSNDATLATSTTETIDVTGLTNGTTYYLNMAAVDTKGLATGLGTEASAVPAGSGGSPSDSTPPGIATEVAATVNDSFQVILTWVDPTASDLNKIQIIKSNEANGIESILATISPDVETYTDTTSKKGEVLNYKIRAIDATGNVGVYSEKIQITVDKNATAVVTEEAEKEVVVEEEVAVEEDGSTEETSENGEESFSDIAGHWGTEAIEAMAASDIVKGDPDGKFRPDDSLNRAEAAALLYRLLGLEEPTAPTAKPFSDVETDLWYSGYVGELKGLELVNGNPDGTYMPGKDINRAEFLHLALNVYYYLGSDELKAEIDGYRADDSASKFADVETGLWYSGTLKAAGSMELVSGESCDDGTCFYPARSITRAEATQILFNMFK